MLKGVRRVNRAELKKWAKEKIKGHIFDLLIPIVITSVLTNLTIGQKFTTENGSFQVSGGYPVGILFYFVEVGLAYFMVKFITNQEYNLKDIFNYTSDVVRAFLTALLSKIFIFLWTLLLIVPGIIKAFAYTLIPLILADEKYKDLSYMEVLKKSEEIMNGHKMDYFMLGLSFIGWHILAIFTLGLLEIWILPYQQTASYKFLNDIKTEYEAQN